MDRVYKVTALALLQSSPPTFPETQSRDTDGRTMPLRAAALLSAILLVWLPTALCHGDLSLGDIVRNLTADVSGDTRRSVEYQELRSGQERLQNQLTVLQDPADSTVRC